MTQVILASASQSRADVLRRAGVHCETIPSRLDEDAAKLAMRSEGLKPHDQAMRLAELKAQKVSSQTSGLVIGGDQMMSLGADVFDKPKDMAEASATLRTLQGRTHTLETAIVVAEGGSIVWRHLAQPKLTMRGLTDREIGAYLGCVGEDILSTVGAYKLEAEGVRLFSEIEGDFFSILGMPLLPLLDYLGERGALDW